jgi:Ca2+-binding RTX toxin-like protein
VLKENEVSARYRVLAIGLAATVLVVVVPSPSLATKPLCLGKRATIVGTSKGEKIVGTNKVDVIYAGGGYDRVDGRKGNDTICGGGGNDLLLGKGGHDQLSAGPGNDQLEGGSGNDGLMGDDGDDFVYYVHSSAGVVADLTTGSVTGVGNDMLNSIEVFVGSGGNDSVTGTSGPDAVIAGPGNDTISTGDGDDLISGGGGDDSIDGGAGIYDAIDFGYSTEPIWLDLSINYASGEGTDVVTNIEMAYGSPVEDVLKAGATTVYFYGQGGNDQISGGPSSDWLEGGDGHDAMYGHEGNDHIDGGPGSDGLDGGPGTDTCISPGTYMNCETITFDP